MEPALVELTDFDPVDGARVAGWATSEREALHWCGHRGFPVPAELVASWGEADDVRAYLLRDGDTAVGYGELWLDDDEVELARLIVAPGARGRGIGRRLLGALGERAAGTGVPLVFLRVHPENAPALRCYAGAGWAEADAGTAAEWNEKQPVAYRWFTRPGG